MIGPMAEDAGDDAGVLVLAATPIGRAGDAPPRLADELAGADVVAAEDTRRLRRLCADLSVDAPAVGWCRTSRATRRRVRRPSSTRCSQGSGSCW